MLIQFAGSFKFYVANLFLISCSSVYISALQLSSIFLKLQLACLRDQVCYLYNISCVAIHYNYTDWWGKTIDLPKFKLIKYVDRETSQHEQIELFIKLTPHWDDIASRIGVSLAGIREIRGEGMGKPARNCLTDVLEIWEDMSNATYPATWKGVHSFLNDSGRGGLAKKLKAAIDARISTFLGNYTGMYKIMKTLTETCSQIMLSFIGQQSGSKSGASGKNK